MKQPMFERRHYRAVADLLSKLPPCEHGDLVIERFADMFAGDNPRFQRKRFFIACDERRYIVTPAGEAYLDTGEAISV